MNHTKTLVNSALATVFAVGLTMSPGNAQAAKAGFEKCTGIVKAGKNDCGTSKHACAGQSTKDASASEWLYVPTGTCNKISGGKVKS